MLEHFGGICDAAYADGAVFVVSGWMCGSKVRTHTYVWHCDN